uniref:Uncharacterized protein n=1 Tax=Acrobeloides nanus TaxID=290746 RepID=A0A914DPX3_9BILA
MCVWYRSAPLCGNGNDCPTEYPYLESQASSSSDAQYCKNTFGAQCWTGEKNLCCGPNSVSLQNTGNYTCGNAFKKNE